MAGRDRTLTAQLDRLYARLPRLDCRRRCQAACGPVHFLPIEWQHMVAQRGSEPVATEAHRLACRCPLLNPHTGLCTVYAVRPLICRLFGSVKRMACPYGCWPSRWLTDKEAGRLLRSIQALLPGPLRSPFPEVQDLEAAARELKAAGFL